MKKRCCYVIKNIIMAVFCIFTVFSHCLFALASDDDEYLNLYNLDMIKSYLFFTLYGFNGDYSYTYNDTYTTTGSFSESASFSITGSNGISIAGQSEDELHGGIQLFPIDDGEFNLDIISNIMIGQIRPNDGSASTLRLSCTYSYDGQQPPGPASAICTDPNFTDTTRYNVYLYPEAGGITLEGRPSTQMIHFVDADDESEYGSTVWTEGTSTFSGSLSLHENGSLSGSGTISLSTTRVNRNRLIYTYPIMQLNGNLINPSTSNRDTKYRFRILDSDPFIIALFSINYMNALDFSVAPVYDENNTVSGSDVFNFVGVRTNRDTFGGLNFFAIQSKAGLNLNQNQVILLGNTYKTSKFIPLYVGYKSQMSDDVYRIIYGNDRIEQAIRDLQTITKDGTLESQNKGQQLNTQTGQMQSQMNTFQNIEDTAGDNMNAALQNINTNPSLISNNKFLMSVDWIRQQYNRIVTNTPFEAVITFCLVFGLGLLLLGKVR